MKSDNLAIVAAEIERMSSKDQDRENTLLNVNAMWFMNADEKNETQKSLSKMIQNFENLFHWELMKIERADKIFMMWKKLKCIILMCVLNVLLKQTMTTKTQDMTFSYTEMLKMKSNLIVKTVLKWIEHKIIILWCECSFLNKEKIKLTKIVKMMNTKIENNDKKKIITAKKFLNENIILILNSAETKTHMMKKTN